MKALKHDIAGPAHRVLKHDPEKWIPVFGKDHAQTTSESGMTIRRKVITL
jgi:hypothetical protein